MTMDVSGSSPELGSSQNRYSGFNAIARAMPTRFCMPPESSSGYLSSESLTFTLSRRYLARSFFSARLQSVRKSIGNMIFPSTVRKSKSALPWKRTPIFWCNAFFSVSDILVNSSSPYQISPESGSVRPINMLSSTVLPEPLAPISILHSPGRKDIEISFRTCFPSKLF